jgi:hypothetical protein
VNAAALRGRSIASNEAPGLGEKYGYFFADLL